MVSQINILILNLIYFFYKLNLGLMIPPLKEFIHGVVEKDNKDYKNGSVNLIFSMDAIINNTNSATASYLITIQVLISAPTAVLSCLFVSVTKLCGNGRRLILIIGLAGLTICSVFYLLASQFLYFTIPFVMIGASVSGLSCQLTLIPTGILTSLCEYENEYRMTYVSWFIFSGIAGEMLGFLLTGLFMSFSPIRSIFIVVVSLNILLVLTALFCQSSDSKRAKSSYNNFKTIAFSLCENAKKQIYFEKRNYSLVWMVIFAVVTTNGINKANENIIFIYTKHKPFTWTSTTYSFWVFTTKAAHALGMITLATASKQKNFSDVFPLCIGMISQIVQLVSVATINQTWMLFTTCLYSVFVSYVNSAGKTFLCKLTAEPELAVMFSTVSCADAVGGLFISVSLLKLYTWTCQLVPVFVFLYEAMLMLVIFIALNIGYRILTLRGKEDEELSILGDE